MCTQWFIPVASPHIRPGRERRLHHSQPMERSLPHQTVFVLLSGQPDCGSAAGNDVEYQEWCFAARLESGNRLCCWVECRGWSRTLISDGPLHSAFASLFMTFSLCCVRMAGLIVLCGLFCTLHCCIPYLSPALPSDFFFLTFCLSSWTSLILHTVMELLHGPDYSVARIYDTLVLSRVQYDYEDPEY